MSSINNDSDRMIFISIFKQQKQNIIKLRGLQENLAIRVDVNGNHPYHSYKSENKKFHYNILMK